MQRARKFNELLGGPFVAPWNLGRLPAEWYDTLYGLAYDLPRVQAWHKEVQAVVEKGRKVQ